MNRRIFLAGVPLALAACAGDDQATRDPDQKKVAVPAKPLTGINIHVKSAATGETNYLYSKLNQTLEAVVSAGIKMIRVDCNVYTAGDDNSPSGPVVMQSVMAGAHTRGLKVQMVLIAPYRESPTEWGIYPATAAGRYQMGYQTYYNVLSQLNPKPDYVEIENEITKWTGTHIEFGAGGKLTEYNSSAFSQYADVMRGAYQAIRDTTAAKVIVGTLETAFAFIPWAIGQGINMDVAGYHLYLRPADDLNNLYGTGPLQASLKAFGRPVTVNELNGNLAYPQVGQQAVRGFDGLAYAESILGYELFDTIAEPGYGCATIPFRVKPGQAVFMSRLKG